MMLGKVANHTDVAEQAVHVVGRQHEIEIVGTIALLDPPKLPIRVSDSCCMVAIWSSVRPGIRRGLPATSSSSGVEATSDLA